MKQLLLLVAVVLTGWSSFSRHGGGAVVERPVRETFAEHVGVLTHEVFGLEVTRSGFHKMLSETVLDRTAEWLSKSAVEAEEREILIRLGEFARNAATLLARRVALGSIDYVPPKCRFGCKPLKVNSLFEAVAV